MRTTMSDEEAPSSSNGAKGLLPSESSASTTVATGRPKPRAWSFHHDEASALLQHRGDDASSFYMPIGGGKDPQPQQIVDSTAKDNDAMATRFILYVIYALVNVIISVPGLYGYAAVIFNHPVFSPYMNALSKLVIFSSLIHQLGFLIFSSLDFAIGTVQDAGLIFLSSMSNAIAATILDDHGIDFDNGNGDPVVPDHVRKIILSTTIVILSGGTALLGLILILMGKFKLANAVSYLPMPVVGGYLAFIGYFCLLAGVSLCISEPLMQFSDWWTYVLSVPHNLLLALPGLVAALFLTVVSRLAKNDAILPLSMLAIPGLFYIIIYSTGIGLEGAREGGWVGPMAPPVPVSELFTLVDFTLVRWDLVGEVMWTWVGMVFVVSFASCLDVAAVSMDMGKALDTNAELMTVGVCNVMSGLSFGFTGSYIFSQTIFTYRTGVHSRWIGSIIMIVFLYVVISPINLLQVAPLFFLGSTLIFIGYDLLYEWLYEIRHSILLSEYATIWGTFLAIQVVGIDAGIVIGVLVAILETVVTTANNTTIHRVTKRSRAFWTRAEDKILNHNGYHPVSPKIMTMEISGPIFFASALNLLDRVTEEVGIQESERNEEQIDVARRGGPLHSPAAVAARSPHTSSYLLTTDRRRESFQRSPAAGAARQFQERSAQPRQRRPKRKPQYVVLDLTGVSSLDASAARGFFLQFTQLCSQYDMVVCVSGATPRISWMLRSHHAAYSESELERIKAQFQAPIDESERLTGKLPVKTERILMFLTTHEALEFCERSLIHQIQGGVSIGSGSSTEFSSGSGSFEEEQSLSSVFTRILECDEEEERILKQLDDQRYHDEVNFKAGQTIFNKGDASDALFVVLKGIVASGMGREGAVYRHRQQIVSGAGLVREREGSQSNLLDPLLQSGGQIPIVGTMWPVGGVFGYTDQLLDRPRSFSSFSIQNGTHVAQMSRSHMNLLQEEDPALNALLHRVLLRASVLDLAQCTCDDV